MRGDTPYREGKRHAAAIRRTACIFPGQHCPFPVLCVGDRVWACARAAGQAGRPDFLRARARAAARAPARPSTSCTCPAGRCRPTSRVVRLWCGRARPGACRPCPASPRGRMRPLSVYKSMGMPAPARGRQRPRTSPREHVHSRPATLADVATRARARLPLEVGKVLQLVGQLLGRQLLELIALREV